MEKKKDNFEEELKKQIKQSQDMNEALKKVLKGLDKKKSSTTEKSNSSNK